MQRTDNRDCCAVRSDNGRIVFGVGAALLGMVMFFLAGCSEGRDPEGLIERLSSDSESRREKSVDELIRMGDDALPAVKRAFKEAPDSREGAWQVQGAVDVLKDHRTLDALQLLGERVDDDNDDIRLAVIGGVAELADVGKMYSIDILDGAMEDSSGEIIEVAARGLRRMDFQEATLVLEKHFQESDGLSAVYAAQNLYRIDRRAEAAELLLNKLDATDSAVQEAAQKACVDLGTDRNTGDEFVSFSLDYIQDNEEIDRVESVLEEIRDDYFEELDRALPPSRMRRVLLLLGKIADRKSVDRLKDMLTSSDESGAARVAAAEALSSVALSERSGGDEQLRTEIKEVMEGIIEKDDPDDRVAIAASIALSQLQESVGVRYLLDKLEELTEMGGEDSEEKSRTVEPEEMTELRIRAQEALTTSGDFVVPHLMEKLEDGDTGRILSWAAARTLGDLRVDEAAPHMKEMLTNTVAAEQVDPGANDPEEEIELATEDDSETLATDRASVLKKMFDDREVIPARDLSVRMAAARALGRIGGEGAAEALETAEERETTVYEKMELFLSERVYDEMIPDAAVDEAEVKEARDNLEEVAENVIQDAEKALFSIRQAQNSLDEAS